MTDEKQPSPAELLATLNQAERDLLNPDRRDSFAHRRYWLDRVRTLRSKLLREGVRYE